MEKLNLVNEYISRCNSVIDGNDIKKAEELQKEIIGVFSSEIKNIDDQLDNYSMSGIYNNDCQVDFIGDMRLLKSKLINYAADIKLEHEKRQYQLELARLNQPTISAHAEANPTQTATASAHVNITVTVEHVIKQIDKLPDSVLSKEDKEQLRGYVYTIEGIKSSKDKNRLWEKAKEVLKFIAGKSIDVAIVLLPFIIERLAS